jgi:Ankyrin repeats (3 copies)
VVDIETDEVYGHVVAADDFGEAQAIPLNETLRDMRLQLSAVSVRIPTPEDIRNWQRQPQRQFIPPPRESLSSCVCLGPYHYGRHSSRHRDARAVEADKPPTMVADRIDDAVYPRLWEDFDKALLFPSVHHSTSMDSAQNSSGDSQILHLLLSRGRPQPTSMKYILPLIPLSRPKDRYDMTKLIVDASNPVGIEMTVANDASIKAVESPSNQPDLDLIELIISAGADVNCSNGKCFQVAAKCGNIQLLEILCRKVPHPSSLSLALNESMTLALRPLRMDIVKLLLIGEVERGAVADATIKILEDRSVDDELVLLLLTKTDLENQGSRALRLAVRKASITVTSAIIQAVSRNQEILGNALPETLDYALEGRRAKLDLILQAGVSQRSLDQALAGEIRNRTACDISIVESLLRYKVSCNYDNGEALKIAVENRDLDICTLLINSRPDKGILGNMLITAIEKTNGEMKTKLTNLLLEGGAGGSQISAALRQEICYCSLQDMNIVRLLIRYGARVDVFGGAAIKHAISGSRSVQLLQVLLTAKGAPDIIDSLIPEAMTLDRTRRLAMVDMLLSNGAHGPLVDGVLVWAISKGGPEKPIVDLILQKAKALNLNHENGKCLNEAARCASKDVLDNLLQRKPGLSTLRAGFLGIFESDGDELTLINKAQSFIQNCPEHCVILFHDGIFARDSFYQCLHRHADKPDLLQWLLDNGCPADQRFEWQLNDRHGSEEVSPLLWLLCQDDERTNQRTIAILAGNEGKYTNNDAAKRSCSRLTVADPNYRSPRSCTTPLIIAAKFSQQNAVLELLQAGANANVADDQDNPPLYFATKTTDLESMRLLLAFGAYADDESLHIAARNVKPDAIKLLLEKGASVDIPGFRCCEGRTALNELCLKVESPVDNSNLKESLKILLEAERKLSGPCTNRSPFFSALDNKSIARELTQTILALSASLRDELNRDINICRKINDNSELCYSLTMYVRHFRCKNSPRNARGGSQRRTSHFRPDPITSCCGSSTCHAPALEQLLRHYGCQDRYWDERVGANQPAGVCNPPSYIVEAQREAENEAKKRAEHERRLKEEADLRAAMMATKEAEAAHERQLARERKQRKEEEIDAEKEDAKRNQYLTHGNQPVDLEPQYLGPNWLQTRPHCFHDQTTMAVPFGISILDVAKAIQVARDIYRNCFIEAQGASKFILRYKSPTPKPAGFNYLRGELTHRENQITNTDSSSTTFKP